MSERRKNCLGCSTFWHGRGRARLHRPGSRNLFAPNISHSFLEVAMTIILLRWWRCGPQTAAFYGKWLNSNTFQSKIVYLPWKAFMSNIKTTDFSQVEMAGKLKCVPLWAPSLNSASVEKYQAWCLISLPFTAPPIPAPSHSPFFVFFHRLSCSMQVRYCHYHISRWVAKL